MVREQPKRKSIVTSGKATRNSRVSGGGKREDRVAAAEGDDEIDCGDVEEDDEDDEDAALNKQKVGIFMVALLSPVSHQPCYLD